MNTLLDWWSFIWQLYMSALHFADQLGGVAMVLIWVLATAAAFAALVVAPALFVFQLVAFAFVLAMKASMVLLFAGSAMTVASSLERLKVDQTTNVAQVVEPNAAKFFPATDPRRDCKQVNTGQLNDHVVNYLLVLAVEEVSNYNRDIQRKVDVIRTSGLKLNEALIVEGLNPSFRMIPPKEQIWRKCSISRHLLSRHVTLLLRWVGAKHGIKSR